VRYFGKRREKFQSAAQFAAINKAWRDIVVIRNNPAYFVGVAVSPEKPTNLPNVTMSAAMRASLEIAPSIQRKGHHIVGNRPHHGSIFDHHAAIGL